MTSVGLAGAWAASYPELDAAENKGAGKDLGDLVAEVLAEFKLPGMAAAVTSDAQLLGTGVAGLRKVGTEDKIKVNDRFLIGSCTKRMTGLMIARLVDSGKLSYEITLAEALPDLPMRADYREVTIGQVLGFVGGIQPYTQIGPGMTPILFELTGTISEQREKFIRHVLDEEPVAKPGTERKYSNASYALAAFAASRKTKLEWEKLIEREVFKPLGFTKGGFGPPRTKDQPDEPWLHSKGDNGYEPQPEELKMQPATILAAAGGVHCSIDDFAKFAAYEMSAAQGKDKLLGEKTSKRWKEMSRGDASGGQPVFGGSQWLTAAYVIWPDKNLAAAVAVNGGGAIAACRRVLDGLKARFG